MPAVVSIERQVYIMQIPFYWHFIMYNKIRYLCSLCLKNIATC